MGETMAGCRVNIDEVILGLNMGRQRKRLALLTAVLVAGSAAASDSPPNDSSTSSATPDLPRPHMPGTREYYPKAAKAKHIQGRLLIEFGIDEHGKARNARLLNEDAEPLLVQGARDIMRDIKFDLPKAGVEQITSTTFRITLMFCIRSCKGMEAFPGTAMITTVSD